MSEAMVERKTERNGRMAKMSVEVRLLSVACLCFIVAQYGVAGIYCGAVDRIAGAQSAVPIRGEDEGRFRSSLKGDVMKRLQWLMAAAGVSAL
jgi:hypothetical protein